MLLNDNVGCYCKSGNEQAVIVAILSIELTSKRLLKAWEDGSNAATLSLRYLVNLVLSKQLELSPIDRSAGGVTQIKFWAGSVVGTGRYLPDPP